VLELERKTAMSDGYQTFHVQRRDAVLDAKTAG